MTFFDWSSGLGEDSSGHTHPDTQSMVQILVRFVQYSCWDDFDTNYKNKIIAFSEMTSFLPHGLLRPLAVPQIACGASSPRTTKWECASRWTQKAVIDGTRGTAMVLTKPPSSAKFRVNFLLFYFSSNAMPIVCVHCSMLYKKPTQSWHLSRIVHLLRCSDS